MMQEKSHRFGWYFLDRSCVCGKDMPEQVRSDSNGFSRSCCESETVEEKSQQSFHICTGKQANSSVGGGRPLKQKWLSMHIFGLRMIVGINDRDGASVGGFHQLANFSEH